MSLFFLMKFEKSKESGTIIIYNAREMMMHLDCHLYPFLYLGLLNLKKKSTFTHSRYIEAHKNKISFFRKKLYCLSFYVMHKRISKE